ncbi:MAG: hypothetical protein J0I14_10290 [Propionibacteriaceae bacterium]|nr:hypothetical protein [Propionibacteriaceae bacterium]
MTRDLLVAIGLIEIVLVLAGVRALRALWHRRSDPALAARWEHALVARADGVEIAFVERVYQHARRGSKAIIVWLRAGRRQDAWFEGSQERPGRYLLLTGSVGYGPHNDNPDVLFVHSGEVLATLPRRAPKAWRRQQRRLRRRTANAGHAALPRPDSIGPPEP